MPRDDFSRLFNQLDALSVGFGPLFRDFEAATQSYPPHNIVKTTDNVFILELAVAGFKKHELSVEEHQGILTIKGSKENFGEDHQDVYQHRGIAKRSFVKTFRIAEFFEVVNSKLEDGILSITFMKNVPPEAQPKAIPIG
jgi:molecular chaperone IbpA